ncbi:carboxypeptidase B-like [Zerene cesonia]|uniref:carboxypeptidase B-like n=1 Tax=Zerene cesonia TaxID=33412 RepID=UPI0018E5A281|nr:carboxypeptidase B-like [Zerene cesonia]
MDMKTFAIFLLIFLHSSFGKYEQYEGYTVYGVVIRNQDDVNLIRELENELDLDIWRAGMPGVRHADIMVGPKQSEIAIKKFDEDLIQWTRNRQNVEVYNKYARLAEIDAYMERLAREYPDIVKVVTAGLSFEGRPMKYLKISTTNFEDPNKPIYFMDAAMHAREWVTTPVALYTIHRLVEGLQDEDRDLRDNVDWIILPDRMWRQSRSFNPEIHEECRGVDLNRNFDIFFMEINASNNPCSNIPPKYLPQINLETWSGIAETARLASLFYRVRR